MGDRQAFTSLAKRVEGLVLFVLLTLVSFPAAAVADETLVAAYGFEEGTGTTVIDSSLNGNDGVLEGDAVRTFAGRFGAAVEFNGDSGSVSLGGLDVVGTGLSILAWCNADDFGTDDGRIISKATSSDEQDHTWMLSTVESNGIRLRCRIKTVDGVTTTLVGGDPTLSAGEWFHAALTFDGARMNLYLNGVEVGSAEKIGALATDPSVPVTIGANANSVGHFDGRIDEVQIFNRALTAAEIQQQMGTPLVAVDTNCREISFDPFFPSSCDTLSVELRELDAVTVISERTLEVSGLSGFDVAQKIFAVFSANAPGGFAFGLRPSGVKLCRAGEPFRVYIGDDEVVPPNPPASQDICNLKITEAAPCQDSDNDGWCDGEDICPGTYNPLQEDCNAGQPSGFCRRVKIEPLGIGECNDLRIEIREDDGVTVIASRIVSGILDRELIGLDVAKELCQAFVGTLPPELTVHPDLNSCTLCRGSGFPFRLVLLYEDREGASQVSEMTFGTVGDACGLRSWPQTLDCSDPVEGGDMDDDGVCDVTDNCATVWNLSQHDADGNGVGDACDPCVQDADADMACDSVDNCPLVSNLDQRDTDGDGTGDECDQCPLSAGNQDTDGDGICDSSDNCDTVSNPNQEDADGDGAGDACDECPLSVGNQDTDGDGVCDLDDNCPVVPNLSQADADSDGIGDACDPCTLVGEAQDSDGDNVCDSTDNCPSVSNVTQSDVDGDGIGDACDNCPMSPSELDSDSDGVCDAIDNCPLKANASQRDGDDDDLGDACDNCPGTFNPAQQDIDGNGVGDMCQVMETPFVRGDINGDLKVDIADAIFLLSAQFIGNVTIRCADAADANDDGKVDIADSIFVLSFVFLGSTAPPFPGPNHPGTDPTSDSLDCQP